MTRPASAESEHLFGDLGPPFLPLDLAEPVFGRFERSEHSISPDGHGRVQWTFRSLGPAVRNVPIGGRFRFNVSIFAAPTDVTKRNCKFEATPRKGVRWIRMSFV